MLTQGHWLASEPTPNSGLVLPEQACAHILPSTLALLLVTDWFATIACPYIKTKMLCFAGKDDKLLLDPRL